MNRSFQKARMILENQRLKKCKSTRCNLMYIYLKLTKHNFKSDCTGEHNENIRRNITKEEGFLLDRNIFFSRFRSSTWAYEAVREVQKRRYLLQVKTRRNLSLIIVNMISVNVSYFLLYCLVCFLIHRTRH